MPPKKNLIATVLARLGAFREGAGLTKAQVEEALLLGPGWVERFESGKTVPALDMMLALLALYGKSPGELFAKVTNTELPNTIVRNIYAEQVGNDLLVRFTYASHDAEYRLPNAQEAQFHEVVKALRDGLAKLAAYPAEVEVAEGEGGAANSEAAEEQVKAIKTDAVANAFLKAVQTWPHANPSDVWWFVIYRAYCDPFNHPASFARLNLDQSWKRTGGWALERILVAHYAEFLQTEGVKLFIAAREQRASLAATFALPGVRVEADKIDVYLAGTIDGRGVPFGVVHVKASFAERRTDDVPLSEALIRAGYTSPLWTMDCKSTPGVAPINKGELGQAGGAPVAPGKKAPRKSAKRKDIEDDQLFSACFSYNRNTEPTVATNAKARVVVCDFKNPDDAFSKFIIQAWKDFKAKQAQGRKKPGPAE